MESKAKLQLYIGCSGRSYSSWYGCINEKDSGEIQKDREKGVALWAEEVKKVQKEIGLVIVAANNHYAGFAPATANGFRKMVEKSQKMTQSCPSIVPYPSGPMNFLEISILDRMAVMLW